MRYSKSFLGFILTMLFVWAGLVQAQTRNINWDAFSVNLVKAIKSGHPGLQQSAMQRIIQYADNLDVEDAVWTISQISRFDNDSRVRRLAMVTLYNIKSDKALAYIGQNLKLEKDQTIKKHGCCMLQEYYAAKKLENVSETVITAK